MRRADARSRKIRSPEGVAFRLQVSAYSIEPAQSVSAANLFPKEAVRATLADEGKPCRPEMAFVRFSRSLARCREGLAGARACPNRPICWPAGELQGVVPSSDSGEEMAAGKAFEVFCFDIDNAPFVNGPWSNKVSGNQLTEPSSGTRFDVIVKG
jgi:hypothetical protein